MHFVVGLLLVIALSLTPAPAPEPEPSDSNTTGRVVIQTGTGGTHIGWTVTSGNENLKVTIGDVHSFTE